MKLRRIHQPWLAASLMVTILVAFTSTASAGKVEDLAKALLNDQSYKVRTQAAMLLGKLGESAGVEPLISALVDEHKTVRAMAAQSLGKLGGDKAAAALKDLLTRESESFVRNQADKALAVINAAKSPKTESSKDRKVYLKIGPFTGGSKAADSALLTILRNILRETLEKLPFIVVSETFDDKAIARSGRPAFLVDGNVFKLDGKEAGSALETSCEVKVMVARWPSRSVILWTSAGAAVQGGRRDRDKANARQDCIEASAGQLGDSLIGFFKSQGG
jgi:hypothetical protein